MHRQSIYQSFRSRGRLALLAVFFVVLCAHVAHAATLTVAWDPPVDATVSGYVLSYGTSPGEYTMEVDVGNVTSVRLDGLDEAFTYYFVVQSRDSDGNRSARSNEVAYTPFSVGCRVTYAVSSDGEPVSVTLEPPVIVGGTPPPQSATCAPVSGSLFPIGDTPVTCTASDATTTVRCQSVVSVSYRPPDSTGPAASGGGLKPAGAATAKRAPHRRPRVRK